MPYQFLESYSPLNHQFIVHRVNIADIQTIKIQPDLIKLVGAKTSITIGDSHSKKILIPPGAGVEVDFWVFDKGKIIISHHNPALDRIEDYPNIESYLNLWQEKRLLEKKLNIPHGIILANLKTHGSEELFLEKICEYDIPLEEVILLDIELPALDRLLSQKKSNLAHRVSRVESFESILLTLQQTAHLSAPKAIFYDPNGFWNKENFWPFAKSNIDSLYALSPDIQFIVCCPSRFGQMTQIDTLGRRLTQTGIKINYIMTDLELRKFWLPYLR